jgi:NAD(P)-dependent dehydrogenase (short-subunit alcohol dehydrogenase family)
MVLRFGSAAVVEMLRSGVSMSRALPPAGRRSIFITGAASGIGLEAARRFAAAGWFVGLFDVDTTTVAREAAAIGSDTCCFGECDVSSVSSVAKAMEAFEQKFGRMDCLFNCAGVLRVGALEDVDLDAQLLQTRVNLDGVVICTRAALPLLKKTAASVVISRASASALYGSPDHAVYSATKHAVWALTEALAIELEQYGIRVCDVYAGYVNTPMLASDETVPKRSRLLQATDRWLSAQSVAEVIFRAVTANSGAASHRLHVPVNMDNWILSKLIKADLLFGLGLSHPIMRTLVMGQSRL